MKKGKAWRLAAALVAALVATAYFAPPGAWLTVLILVIPGIAVVASFLFLELEAMKGGDDTGFFPEDKTRSESWLPGRRED